MGKLSNKKNNSLKDSFKREIDYLRISATDRCNLKCIYCMPDKGIKYFDPSECLTSEEITRFVRIASKQGLRKVRITGGEPLMRGDILSLVSSIKATGISDLSITTNGIKLGAIAHELKEAGLDRVNISLDTLTPSKYRDITRGGNINHIWRAIEEAEKAGLYPIKINIVPIKGINDDEINDFAALTISKDYHVRFIEFMPVGKSRLWTKENYVKMVEVKEKVSSLGELTQLEFKGKGPSRNFRLKGAKGIIGFISPITDCFCDFCNRLRLTAHGKIRPCLFSDIEIDVKSPLREGISDEGLEKLLKEAVRVKPERHYLRKERREFTDLVSMSKIGG